MMGENWIGPFQMDFGVFVWANSFLCIALKYVYKKTPLLDN